MFCDFHTHNAKPAEQVLKLLSAAELPEEDLPGVFFALELHPWNLPESFTGLPENFLNQIRQADAIGEVGLDRLQGPAMDVQRQYLRAVLEAAADCGKPVVFHCVRAYPELLAEIKPFPQIRKMLHGFQGNEEKAKMLTDAGFLLTSRQTLYPGGGLETDAANLSIQEVYDSCKVTEEISVELEDRFFRFLQG